MGLQLSLRLLARSTGLALSHFIPQGTRDARGQLLPFPVPDERERALRPIQAIFFFPLLGERIERRNALLKN